MTKNTLALLFALTFSAALASGLHAEETAAPLDDAAVRARVLAAPTEKDRPDLDGIVLFEGVFTKYAAGLAEVRHQRLVKVYTEWAIEHLGDPRLYHDGRRQELTVHASRTYFPDGTSIDSPDNAFNDVTPDGLDLSTDHIGIREMVVTHTGLVREVTIFLDWTVKDKETNGLPFSALHFPHGEFAALEKVFVADGLHGETVNPPDALYDFGTPEKKGDRLVWHARDLEAAPLAMHGRDGDQLPWIALSSSASWEDALGAVALRVEEAASERSALPAILEKLEKEEPFLSVQDALDGMAGMLVDRTSMVRYEQWTCMIDPRSADDAFHRSTTTPLERCALMIACCAEKGIPAELTFPARWGTIPANVPALEALGAPVLRLPVSRGEVLWVDPGSGGVSLLPPFRRGVDFFSARGSAVARNRHAYASTVVNLSVYWDLVSGEGKLDGLFTGEMAGDHRQPGQDVKAWVSEWSEGAEAGDVTIDMATPGRVRFHGTVSAPIPEKNDRDRVVLALPMIDDPAGLLPALPGPARSGSDEVLFGAGPVDVKLSWTVRIPEGMTLEPAPNAGSTCPGGEFEVKRSVDDQLVKVEYRLAWDGSAVSPGGYPAYRAFHRAVTDERSTRLLFAAEPESD